MEDEEPPPLPLFLSLLFPFDCSPLLLLELLFETESEEDSSAWLSAAKTNAMIF